MASQVLLDLGFGRWALEALMIASVVPAPRDRSFIVSAFLWQQGYCGFDSLPGISSLTMSSFSPSNSSSSSSSSIINMTGYNASFSAAEDSVTLLPSSSAVPGGGGGNYTDNLSLYNNPSRIQDQCLPYLAIDLGMLFILGCALRLITYVYLAWKRHG